MNQSSAVRTAPAPDEAPATTGEATQPITVATRFGEMVVDPGSTILMPRGLLGFTELRDFALAALAEERYARFQLLQSLDDASLSFIVLPYDAALGAIAPEDVTEAYRALGIAEQDGVMLLIVSVRRAGEEASVSVNLRAPIVVDVQNRRAWQFVLSNPAYPVRQDLAALSKA
jgi:flagellar assembly factor FliW